MPTTAKILWSWCRCLPALIAWVHDWIEKHHEEEKFIKRRRDKRRVDEVEVGIGDARIRQIADVYRAPSKRAKPEALQ